MRRAPGVVSLIVLALVGTGCATQRATFADQVREAVVATTLQPRSYTFVDQPIDGAQTVVEVVVEDDFRYSAQWALDGDVVYREVVVDDALAASATDFDLVMSRLGATEEVELEAEAVAGLVATDLDTGQQVPFELDGDIADLVADLRGDAAPPAVAGSLALRDGGWVVDQLGAPPLGIGASLERLGTDPIVDAVTILDLVRATINGAGDISRWDDSAIEYRPEEDPFRAPSRPEEGPQEVRYDVEPIDPPSRAELTDPAAVVSVTAEALRQLAVYVVDGMVTEVRLRVDASPIHEQIEKAFDLSTEGTDEERSSRALEVINQFRSTLGQPVIVPREIVVTFDSVGSAPSVALPDGTVGSLAFLANRGSAAGRLPEPDTEPSVSPTGTDDS